MIDEEMGVQDPHDRKAGSAAHASDDKEEDVAAPEAVGEPKHAMTIEEAARKGGNTTKQRYGPDFYSKIGRKGGQRVARERGPEFYSEIGRKGGEARVAQSRKLEHDREDAEE